MTAPVGDFLDGRFVVPAAPDGELAFPAPGRLDLVPYRAPWALAHVERAVAAARAAQEGWRKTPQAQRSALLRAYGAALVRRKAELSAAISASIGKPLWESATEVDAMIAKVEISLGAGLALLDYPVTPDANTALRTRPIGVCAVLGPFNFPGHLANGHFVPALATGNTIVFKPSERAPQVGALIAACMEEAQFPPGVFNLVQGAAEVASALVAHDGVDGVMFTGSTAVGSRILSASAKSPGRMLALELGGRNCALVLSDADLLHAAREIAFSAFVTAGQRCTANSRILVHRSVAEALTEKLTYAAQHTRVGAWDADDVFLGPVISAQAVERLEAVVAEGATAFEALVPLRRAEVGARGHYLSPAVYRLREGARADSVTLGHEELFGPLLTVEPFDDVDEAVARANSSRYGLAAAVFTASKESFERCADGLDVGLCNWNRASVGSSSKLPFGGRKQSGNHRPAGLFSAYACVDAVAQLHVPTPPAQVTLSPGLKVR